MQVHINELPKEQQEVILLRYGQDLKVNDIAAITGTTRFVVMYRLRNALAALKKRITCHFGDFFFHNLLSSL